MPNANAVITFTIATSIVNWTGHGLAVDTQVDFQGWAGAVMPTNVPTIGSTNSLFYVESVVNANSFKIKQSLTSAAIVMTGTSSGTIYGNASVQSWDIARIRATSSIASAILSSVDHVGASANHGLSMGEKVVFPPQENIPSGFVSGMPYYVVSIPSLDTLSLSATVGGGAITATSAVTSSLTEYSGDELADPALVLTTVALPVTFTLSNVAVGSRVQVVEAANTSKVLYAGEATANIVSFAAKFSGVCRIDIRKASTSPKYKPYRTNGVVGANGLSVYVSQELDDIAA